MIECLETSAEDFRSMLETEGIVTYRAGEVLEVGDELVSLLLTDYFAPGSEPAFVNMERRLLPSDTMPRPGQTICMVRTRELGQVTATSVILAD